MAYYASLLASLDLLNFHFEASIISVYIEISGVIFTTFHFLRNLQKWHNKIRCLKVGKPSLPCVMERSSLLGPRIQIFGSKQASYKQGGINRVKLTFFMYLDCKQWIHVIGSDISLTSKLHILTKNLKILFYCFKIPLLTQAKLTMLVTFNIFCILFSICVNRTARSRNQCRKTTVFSCYWCLINTCFDKMNYM